METIQNDYKMHKLYRRIAIIGPVKNPNKIQIHKVFNDKDKMIGTININSIGLISII